MLFENVSGTVEHSFPKTENFHEMEQNGKGFIPQTYNVLNIIASQKVEEIKAVPISVSAPVSPGDRISQGKDSEVDAVFKRRIVFGWGFYVWGFRR